MGTEKATAKLQGYIGHMWLIYVNGEDKGSMFLPVQPQDYTVNNPWDHDVSLMWQFAVMDIWHNNRFQERLVF
jgi:hypothetical protein